MIRTYYEKNMRLLKMKKLNKEWVLSWVLSSETFKKVLSLSQPIPIGSIFPVSLGWRVNFVSKIRCGSLSQPILISIIFPVSLWWRGNFVSKIRWGSLWNTTIKQTCLDCNQIEWHKNFDSCLSISRKKIDHL